MSNRFSSLRGIVAGFAVVASVALGSQANARGVVIDNSGNWHTFGACGVAAGCSATTLGFSVSTGGALTNQIYIYNDGVVSIGAPLSAGSIAKLSDPTA